MQICVKALPRIPPEEIVLFRSIVTLIICSVLLMRKKISPLGNNRKILFLRGMFGAIALFLYFLTIKKMPFASAVTIHHLTPIFTILLATIFLKESTNYKQWLCFICAFIGVCMIKGFDQRVELIYFLLGIFSALCAGAAYNFVRVLRHTDHPLVVIFYFPLITIPLITPFALYNWKYPSPWELFLLLSIGLLTHFAQYFMTYSYQLEKHHNVMIYNYLAIPNSLIFGFFLFNELIPYQSVLAILLILLSMVVAHHIRRSAVS